MSNIPPTIPPVSQGLTANDRAHLNTLGICYYITGGLQLFGVCAGLFYMVAGIVALAGGELGSTPEDPEGAKIFGAVFTGIGVFIVLLCGVLGYLYYLTGKRLREGYGKTMITVMAALSLLSIPLGTILGIFTFVVMSRPQVAAHFASNQR